MRAHTHLISLQSTRTLRLRIASQSILTSLVLITTHSQVSVQGAFNKQILLTKTTATKIWRRPTLSLFSLSLFSSLQCFACNSRKILKSPFLSQLWSYAMQPVGCWGGGVSSTATRQAQVYSNTLRLWGEKAGCPEMEHWPRKPKTTEHAWTGQESWEQEMRPGKHIAKLSLLGHLMNA